MSAWAAARLLLLLFAGAWLLVTAHDESNMLFGVVLMVAAIVGAGRNDTRYKD